MKYKCVTLWHKNSNGEYERTIFDSATVKKCDFGDVLGSGITKKRNYTIRIFTIKKLDISVGDKILDEYDASLYPQAEAYIIKEIKDNRNASGRLRHYRLECV